jgi:hypothetical protein
LSEKTAEGYGVERDCVHVERVAPAKDNGLRLTPGGILDSARSLGRWWGWKFHEVS